MSIKTYIENTITLIGIDKKFTQLLSEDFGNFNPDAKSARSFHNLLIEGRFLLGERDSNNAEQFWNSVREIEHGAREGKLMGTPLIYTALNGETRDVKQILDCGVEVDSRDNLKNSALFEVLKLGADKLEMAKFLLENEASLRTKNSKFEMPLNIFVSKNFEAKMLEELFVFFKKEDRAYILFEAINKGNLEAIKALCNNINDRERSNILNSKLPFDSTRSRPLELAVQNNKAEIAEFLIKNGSKMPNDICRIDKKSILNLAVSNLNSDMVRFLLENGLGEDLVERSNLKESEVKKEILDILKDFFSKNDEKSPATSSESISVKQLGGCNKNTTSRLS